MAEQQGYQKHTASKYFPIQLIDILKYKLSVWFVFSIVNIARFKKTKTCPA